MVSRALVLVFALLIAGCAAFAPKTIVAEYPQPPRIERPTLEADHLTEDMTIDVLIQAYRVSIVKLKDYAKQLEKSLDAYRH